MFLYILQIIFNDDIYIILWAFYLKNKVLVISILLILFFLYNKAKRRKRKESGEYIVRPITDVIGTEEERLEELNNDLKPFGFAYDLSQDIFFYNELLAKKLWLL